MADLDDPPLKDRSAGLKAIRDQARAQALPDQAGQIALTPKMLTRFAATTCAP